MNKFKVHRMNLMLSCIFYLIFAIGILFMIIDSNITLEKYREEGIDVMFKVEQKTRSGRLRLPKYYGTYIYKGKTFFNVRLYGNGKYEVGYVLKCKLLTEDMYKVQDMEHDNLLNKITKILFYLVDFFLFVAASWCIFSLYRHNRIMKRGMFEVGIVKSVVEKGNLFFGLVEFKDFNGIMHQVELCFEKRKRIPGQRCALKYLLHKDGNVEAYYYDTRE